MSPLPVALALLLATPGKPEVVAGEAIAVDATPIPLNPADAAQAAVGALRWRGGLLLRSTDRRFGGLSDLAVTPGGERLTAVSDEGQVLGADMRYDARGWLAGLEDAVLRPLRDTHGKPLRGKDNQDAESLAEMPDGSFIVGFERWHRLWRYAAPGAAAEAVAPPRDLRRAPANGGVETLVPLPDDRLLALTEEWVVGGVLQGWFRSGARWYALGYRPEGGLRPSGGCRLPSGDLVVLEREYQPSTGVIARLRRVPASALVPGAVLDGAVIATLARPLNVDNFEGVACRAGEAGETLLYLLSDDNFSAQQRTLLMMFALEPPAE